ncbi:MAG: hypothetical protein VW228_00900 [Pelagibacteraceae bacterium]
MLIILRFFLIFFIFLSVHSFAENRLGPSDYNKLVELGYNKLDAYADDYSKTKAYWFKLEEHLEVKPKYLALLSQKMKVNGKETVNQHIYNSKHHFFGEKKTKCKNKKGSFSIGPINLQKCEYLKMQVIDDSDLKINVFAQMALDHCNETKVKNLKSEDGKDLKISDAQKCNIKYINFSRYEFAKVLKEVGKKEDKETSDKSKKNKKNNQNNKDLEKFKKQCEELGFKPKTEKFGECVLRLLEAAN